MNRYVVTIENTAGSSLGKEHDPIEPDLDGQALRDFVQARREAGTFPEGLLGIVDAHVTPDDSVHANGRVGEDVKLFVSIGVLVEAADEDAAEAVKIPRSMLEALTTMLGDHLGLDEGWEVLMAEPYQPFLVRSRSEAEAFWNVDGRWVDRENATEFTNDERFLRELPEGGEWFQETSQTTNVPKI